METTSTERPESGPRPPVLSGVPADRRRAIVVGASSGIGRALVRRLAGEGYAVAALARRGDALEALREECREDLERAGGRMIVRAHDVVNTGEVPELFAELVEELGGLDLILYVAAVMPAIGPTEYDTEKDLTMLSVNVGGCIAWCNPAATLFTTQRFGTIVGVSSIAGDRGRKGNPVYGTTKAAMNTYLEALRNRLSEVGAHVTTIKPGFVDTAMTAGMENPLWMISADDAAKQILSAARRRVNTKYVPWKWRVVGTVIRSIPSAIFRHLNV
ncbi:MAG: SDR family NAD(P)-dependent oxidoreductase [Planctomycetota bacterium]